MDERRLLLAVALSLLALTLFPLLLHRPGGPSPTPTPAPAQTGSKPLSTSELRESPSPRPAVPSVSDDHERRVEVVGPEFTLAFTNRGARLVSWRLHGFKDERGRPEEMVQASPEGPRPLDVETGREDIDARLRDALFRPTTEFLEVSRTPASESELSFEYADAQIEAKKTLRVRSSGYLVAVEVSVREAGRELPKKLLWGPGVGNPTEAERSVRGYQEPQTVVLAGQAVERVAAEKIAEGGRVVGEARWAGVEGRYFVALLIPPRDRGPVELRSVKLSGEEGPSRVAAQVALPLGDGGPALLYVGPKDHRTLSRAGHRLAQVVPVGDWIGPIVLVLMDLLRWVHGRVGNYGWSIVVLTALINMAMAPFRHYSIANGIKMAKLAPEMKVIQERYRKIPALDPRRQEMQKEVAALYARHGMSMGTQMTVGCLPILLTLPFLIAFYRVLEVSIDLRAASFLWIPDLSHKDPLFITPALMALSMFVMQRLTPTSMDPAQQRIMLMMPLVLGVMFFAAPAGLNLYWLASNVCSIIQQGVTMRIVRRGQEPALKAKGRRR